jgi:hypothetical protein
MRDRNAAWRTGRRDAREKLRIRVEPRNMADPSWKKAKGGLKPALYKRPIARASCVLS